ncbi:MAG: OmpH family outer membrane protein [Gammaproteobacteria bacterium]|nr:OmpH family outer membrane protein [Gammaproteobacteria bacterium]
MKRLLVLVAGVVLSTSVFAANMKIGILSVQEVLHKAPQVAALQTKLKNQFKPQQVKLVAAQKQLTAEMQKLNRDSAIMKPADKKALQKKIIKGQRAFRQLQVGFQHDLTVAQNGAMKAVLNDIRSAVNKVAAKDHYNLILVKSAVAFNDSNLDITKQVISRLK